MRNSCSAYLITYNTRWKLASRFILNFHQLFTYLCKQQQQIFILEIYKCEIRNQHTCLPIIPAGS